MCKTFPFMLLMIFMVLTLLTLLMLLTRKANTVLTRRAGARIAFTG